MKSPVLVKEGKHHKFDNIEFWAEEGVICIEDSRDNTCSVVTCRDFAKRAAAINDEIKHTKYIDDRNRLHDCIEKMQTAFKEAKSQGDASDPKVVAARLKERKRVILVTGW